MKPLKILRTGASLVGALILNDATDSSAQVLTVTTDLQLWLKADAGITIRESDRVAQWDDQSGQGNHAVQGEDNLAPIRVSGAVNGQPVLRFDGVDDYLSVADSPSISFTGDLTTFFVVKFDDFGNYRAVWAKTANNLPAPTDYYTLPGSGRPVVYRGDGTTANLGNFASPTSLTAGSYLTVGFGMEGTTCTHYLASQGTSSGPIPVTTGNTGAPLLIGTRGDLFTKMKGDIAEILIYSRALTPVERVAVADYLAQKYGIVNLPPTVSLAVTPAGPTHPAGTEVTLTAAAADPDGTVTSVQFIANGALLGTASAPPYQLRVALDTAGSYELTARAVDNKDAATTSTPVVRTVTADPGEPVLGVTSTLRLWLKADAGVTTGEGGIVTSWQDQSGQGNHAVSVDPLTAPLVADAAIHNRPALRFDGIDDRLEVADSPSVSFAGEITSFFVVKMDDFATFRAVWAKTAGAGGNLPAPTDFYTLPNSGLPKVYRGDGTTANISFVDGLRPLRAGVFELVGFSTMGNTLTHFLGGYVNGSGGVTTTTADADTPLYIGTRHDQFTRLKGDLTEVLIYEQALNASELRQVQVYMSARYGMPFSSSLNQAPTIALTAPAPGGMAEAPVDVVISADAVDADGSIVRVEFVVNGGVAATDTSAPDSATVNFSVASDSIIYARAVDNFGATTESAPVTFTVTAAEPIPLPALANLRLWLRADEGVTETAGAVSAWNDQSGNFNNALQTAAARRPVLVPDAVNGHPAIRFDGGDDSLVAPSTPSLAITGDISTFFVVNFTDFATFRAVWAKTQNNLPASTDFYTLPNSGQPRVYRGNGGGLIGFSDGMISPPLGEFAIVGFDHSGTTLHHYLNGEANGESEITATLADTGRPLYIGTRDDQFTRMKGDIAEIVIYDIALSAADRSTVISYLGRRYGIATTPELSIVNNGDGTVTVSWPDNVTGWELEAATNLDGPWDPITFGVVNNAYIDFIGARSFYRLKKL